MLWKVVPPEACDPAIFWKLEIGPSAPLSISTFLKALEASRTYELDNALGMRESRLWKLEIGNWKLGLGGNEVRACKVETGNWKLETGM